VKKPDLTPMELDFDTGIGQRANVQRRQASNEQTKKCNAALRGIGTELNFNAENMEYMGSMATHVYGSKILKQVFYMTQNCAQEMPEIVAAKAFEDLRGTIMKSFGHNRPKKRSGF